MTRARAAVVAILCFLVVCVKGFGHRSVPPGTMYIRIPLL